MITLGDMVVKIRADASEFNSSITAAEVNFKTMEKLLSTSSEAMQEAFRRINGEASVWGNSTEIIAQKQAVLKNEISQLIAQGVDPLSPRIEKLQNQYYKLGDESTALTKKQTTLKTQLNDLDNAMGGVGKRALALATNPLVLVGTAVVAIGKAISKSITDLVKYSSQIDDMSKRTGISTDALQEWKYIAEQIGTTLESVTGAVGMMTRGLETNKDEFARLGIVTKNTDGTFRSMTDIFNDTIATLSGMADETERDQMAFKLLGRSAQSLLPIFNSGSESIANLRNEAHTLGIVLSTETIGNAEALGDATEGLKASIRAASMVMVKDMTPALLAIVNGLKDTISKTVSARQEWDAYILATKGQATTQDQLSLAIKGTIAETERLRRALEYRARLDPATIASLEAQSAANKLLEASLRAQAKAMASATEANKLGTQAAKDKATADAAAAASAKKTSDDAKAASDTALARTREQNLIYDTMRDEQTQKIADAYGDRLLADKNSTDQLILNAQKYAATYIPLMEGVRDVTKSIFSQLGTDLANQELSWKSLGTAAINSIGAIVSAMGDQLAAKAAARYIEAIADLVSIIYAPLAPGNFASAAVLTGGAAAAWAAGAALSAVKLASGGLASSPTLAMIGDNSRYPEVVAPLSPDVFAGIANGIIGALASRSRPAGVTESNSMAARSSSMGSSGAINLNVGTLIADDAGMRTLERTLRRFGLQEDVRVGA